LRAISVLARREVVRYFRQPSRLVGSLAQPLLFWLFLGAGFSGSFRSADGGPGYTEFLYPGILLMMLLFAAVYSTITLIEDRTAGFLQGVLVAPVSRLGVVLGKLIGGTAIATFQATVFLLVAPAAGIALTGQLAATLIPLFLLVGMGFTAFGFVIAWSSESVSGYHAVMSVVMIPMWMLSGALFPMESSSPWLAAVTALNPVRYAMVVVRKACYESVPDLMRDPDFVLSLAVTAAWLILTTAAAVYVASRRPKA
jgi:ABC-2 type transport system permease protein